ncbi:alpha-L-rhamnosidase C-terminal domain-containing protein [Pseudaquabacterium rugosum]|uniref:Alpha-L-rhamnosidase C-terminal domain-containing protein n=1 Tax=Pseudaquabacterium rugosum TaxID=2984194 RepID=A0ABU9BD82_9BURK
MPVLPGADALLRRLSDAAHAVTGCTMTLTTTPTSAADGAFAVSASTPTDAARRHWLKTGVALAAGLGLGGCGGGDDGSSADAWSWPAGLDGGRDWLPATGTLRPTAVAGSGGAVSGADGLLTDGSCTLSVAESGPGHVLLDFGRVVGGLPVLEVVSYTGQPVIVQAFSESSAWAETGDATLVFSIASEPDRRTRWPVEATGVMRGRVLQGGQRWLRLSVEGSGSVTLRAVGCEAVTVAAPANPAATGWFRCSDALLQRIWTAGAYTSALNEMAAGSQPMPWLLEAGGADIGPSGLALHQGGSAWTTGEMRFTVTVRRGGIGWVVRGSKLTRLSFTLCAADDADHPDTLLIETGSIFIGGARTLQRVALPAPLAVGATVGVRTVVGASTVDVEIDGQAVASVAVAAIGFLPPGSMGFFNRSGCSALVRDLSVTAGDGSVLYTSTLGLAAADEVRRSFPVGTNPRALMTDGAKRERQVFSMDLVAAAPTLWCTSGAADHVAGTLRLLTDHVTTGGQIASSVDPAVSSPPLDGSTAPQMRWYSASYSTHAIMGLAEYWRQTGDLSLAAELWDRVTGELAWVATLVGSNGLVQTDTSNGLDWHPQFGGPLAGSVSLMNLVYVKALRDAAALATARGVAAQATAWTAQADAVQTALDAVLYNTRTGVYDISDSLRGSIAQDVNALAVLWGLIDAARVPTVLDALDSALDTTYGHRAFSVDSGWSTVISPMVSGFEVGALLRAGRGEAALALIRKGWRMMIEDSTHACGTVWESMTDAGVPSEASVSLAHGWSAAPTALLSRHVMGLRPTAAGWTRWLCKPVLADLQWAGGQLPTPLGAFGARWLRAPASGLAWVLQLEVPAGSQGVVAVPRALGLGAVRVNGRIATLRDADAADSDLDTSAWRYLDVTASGSVRIELATA